MARRIKDIYEENQYNLSLIGPFEAEVVDNKDPDQQGRISVKIPKLYGKQVVTDVRPKFGVYSFSIPKPGMWTWVEFQHLDETLPMWQGSWYPTKRLSPTTEATEEQHIMEIVDKDNENLFTLSMKEAVELLLKERYRGSEVQFDLETGEINIYSDKSPEGTNKAPINLNGNAISLTGMPCARQFDETTHICVVTGAPVKGMITTGSKRVYVSNDQKQGGSTGP